MTKKRGRQWLRFVKRGLQDVTDMLKNKKFECYLLKNKIPGMVISLIMVAVMLFMAGYFDLKDRIRTNVCRDMSQVEVQKDNSDVDISIQLRELIILDMIHMRIWKNRVGITMCSKMESLQSCF